MDLTRRTILLGASSLPLLAGGSILPALAEAAPPSHAEIPPVLFVHGNGDDDGQWKPRPGCPHKRCEGIPKDRASHEA